MIVILPDAKDCARKIGCEVRVGGKVSGGHGAVEKESKTNLECRVTL